MKPFVFFISDLACELVNTYGLSTEEALAEAERVEAEYHNAIAEAMEHESGVIVFEASIYRLEATFDGTEMTRLRRLDLVL